MWNPATDTAGMIPTSGGSAAPFPRTGVVSGFRSEGRSARGVTLIEILVVVGLLSLVVGAWLMGTRQTVGSTAGDQAEAAYYAQLSLFLETFDSDVRMASRLASTTDGCELEIPAREGPQRITYVRREQGIERRQGSRVQLFDFGKAPVKDARLLFRIEEVTP